MEKSVNSARLTLLSKLPISVFAEKFRAFVGSDSEIDLADVTQANGHIFEVVYCGVTFNASVVEKPEQFSGLKSIFCNLDTTQICSALEIGLSGHVEGGERVPAIVQALLGFARKVGLEVDATATIWHPANLVSGFKYFSQAVSAYLAGGAFPVLALINFRNMPRGLITSGGLDMLAGQELQVECGNMAEGEMMRRIVRVVHDIATNGPICRHIILDGLDVNERVDLEPDHDSNLVKMKTYTVLNA